MDTKATLDDQMRAAGMRPTKLRLQLLELIVEHSPVSAYELTELYKTKHTSKLSPTSTYRVLELLTDAFLVHRAASINRYVACCQAVHGDRKKATQLLVCDDCHSVQEVAIPVKTDTASIDLMDYGFRARRGEPVEIQGRCERCSSC